MNKLNYLVGIVLFLSAVSCSLVSVPPKCLSEFRSVMLATHNSYRALHKTAGLRANYTLHAIALKYANSLAESDIFKHSEAPGLGENIAMWGYSDLPDLTNCGVFAKKFAAMWYDEIKTYNFGNPDASTGVTGHFTQLVWAGTKQLGCGLGVNSLNKVYVVCNYFKGGNWLDDRKTNVLPLA